MTINPMMQILGQSKLAPLKNMMNMVRASGNPQMMLNQMMAQNPQFKQVTDYINANGGDPKTAFYKLAQDKGVNPEDVLKQLM